LANYNHSAKDLILVEKGNSYYCYNFIVTRSDRKDRKTEIAIFANWKSTFLRSSYLVSSTIWYRTVGGHCIYFETSRSSSLCRFVHVL